MDGTFERPTGRGTALLYPPLPISTYALALSRRIWNLRARAERGEDVAAELKAALAERARHRAREI